MVLGFSGLAANAAIGLLSIIVLVYAAEVVVSKMQAVAKAFGVSEVVIAMTIVAVGTSLPELALHVIGSFNILMSIADPLSLLEAGPSVFALGSHVDAVTAVNQTANISASTVSNTTQVYQNTSGAVLGANIGSDVVQQTLVLGLVIFSSAVMAGKKGFRFSGKFLIRDYAPMVGTTLMTLILALNWGGVFNFISGGALQVSGTLTRLDGLVLLSSFIMYMYYLYTTRNEELAEQGDAKPSNSPKLDFTVGIVAMAAVLISAEVFLRVVEIAVEHTGLSGSMIGVASVGVVSAFPEMITAISGLRQGSEGVSLGTLIGSNITNPLFAIGLGSLISTYAVPRPLVLWDLPMETATAGILLLYMFSKESIGDFLAKPARRMKLEGIASRLEATENRKISIAGALLLVVLYLVYIYIRFTYFQYDFV
ncbi:MAG: sodium:calcium antiporter [Candidatus Nanosalina sp.]